MGQVRLMLDKLRYRLLGEIAPLRRPRGRLGQSGTRHRRRSLATSPATLATTSSSLPLSSLSSSFRRARSAGRPSLTAPLPLLRPRRASSSRVIAPQAHSLTKIEIESASKLHLSNGGSKIRSKPRTPVHQYQINA